jgi:integrase
MSVGTGRIYRRGSIWWIDYSHRGARQRESSESTKLKDAKALLKKRLGEIANGKLPGRDEERLRLTDIREAVEADFKMNGKKSLDRALLSFKHLARHLGDAPVLSITTGRVRRYITDRQEEGAAASSVRNELIALRRGLNLLHQDARVSRVPKIPGPQLDNTRQGFLTQADLTRVLLHLPDYARPLVRFAYLTGWRSGEVLGLQWSQVDFEAGTVRLEPGTTKNHEGRTFPFRVLPPLAELLERQREHTRQVERLKETIIPWVWHRDGRPIRSIRVAWRNAQKKAGLPGAWFHDLRRSAVRNMERAGVPRSVAMKLSGHKTESVYRRYAIADARAMEEGVEKLARLHAANQDGGLDTRRIVALDEARQA